MGDRESLGDAQEMSHAETVVYEAVAALSVDRRPATVAEVAAMTDFTEETVQECLTALTAAGRLLVKGNAYVLGPHDWGVEY
jgi:hypothetical protein